MENKAILSDDHYHPQIIIDIFTIYAMNPSTSSLPIYRMRHHYAQSLRQSLMQSLFKLPQLHNKSRLHWNVGFYYHYSQINPHSSSAIELSPPLRTWLLPANSFLFLFFMYSWLQLFPRFWKMSTISHCDLGSIPACVVAVVKLNCLFIIFW